MLGQTRTKAHMFQDLLNRFEAMKQIDNTLQTLSFSYTSNIFTVIDRSIGDFFTAEITCNGHSFFTAFYYHGNSYSVVEKGSLDETIQYVIDEFHLVRISRRS